MFHYQSYGIIEGLWTTAAWKLLEVLSSEERTRNHPFPIVGLSLDGPERSRARSCACSARTLDGEDNGEIVNGGDGRHGKGAPTLRASEAA
jgi:hypothetical protein